MEGAPLHPRRSVAFDSQDGRRDEREEAVGQTGAGDRNSERPTHDQDDSDTRGGKKLASSLSLMFLLHRFTLF